ncbi:MAG: hypothetical protein WAU36_09525 [Cyclobacteriaceae bacterium]
MPTSRRLEESYDYGMLSLKPVRPHPAFAKLWLTGPTLSPPVGGHGTGEGAVLANMKCTTTPTRHHEGREA